jgi:hypothetical protein
LFRRFSSLQAEDIVAGKPASIIVNDHVAIQSFKGCFNLVERTCAGAGEATEFDKIRKECKNALSDEDG